MDTVKGSRVQRVIELRYVVPLCKTAALCLLSLTLLGAPAAIQAREICWFEQTSQLVDGGWKVNAREVCVNIGGGEERGGGHFETGGGSGGGPRVDNPGDPGQPTANRDPAVDCDNTAGNPIVYSTGNKVEFEQDFGSSTEMGLFLSRTYNHFWSGTGIFGRHWLSNLDYSLTSSGGGANASNLWLQRPDGRRIKFVRTSSGRWNEDKPEAIAHITLANNVYTHHSEDGMVERYSLTGFVTRVANRQGVGWDFIYSNNYLQRVTHTSGRQILFTWTSGRLTRVTDPAGNQYNYGYTVNAFGAGQHRLASVTLPGAPVTTIQYHYEDNRFPGGLTGKSYNGVRYSNFAYDSNGRATLSEHAGGVDRYTFSYELNQGAPPPPPPPTPPPGGGCDPNTGICTQPRAEGRLQPLAMDVMSMAAPAAGGAGTVRRAIQTNPLGKKTTYEFDGGKLIATIGHASAHCSAASKLVVYDTNGYPSATEDFNGNLSYTTYNAKGQLIEKREAVGTAAERRTTFAWNADNRMTRQTLVGHLETTWAYDSNNRVSSIHMKNLSSNGVASQTRTTGYAYTTHSSGLLSSITINGPLPGSGDSMKYSYAATGDLTRVESGLGHATLYQSHNGLGMPGKITGPNGDVLEMTYDARGRVTRERSYPAGSAADTTYTYDAAGLLSRITLPDGHYREFEYANNRRLMALREPKGGSDFAVTRFTYDAMGNATRTDVLAETWVPTDDAQYVSQNVPGTMNRSQNYAVTVRMKNTGDTTWTTGGGYQLGSQNPANNTTWGLSRVPLPGSVPPGGTATFNFTAKAPATAGSYNFRWRMLKGSSWFGGTSPNVTVSVIGSPPPAASRRRMVRPRHGHLLAAAGGWCASFV